MKYKYLSGYPNCPIKDFDHILDAYEHIGEEMYAHALTFIGIIHGFLHRLQLQPLEQQDRTVYYPLLTQIQLGENVNVATERGTRVLAG